MHILFYALRNEALFLAGKVFLKYRRNKGTKNLPLPDFFIGAHATVSKFNLITRDSTKYKTYFPQLKLIHPKFSKGDMCA